MFSKIKSWCKAVFDSMSFRHWFMTGGSLLAAAMLYLTSSTTGLIFLSFGAGELIKLTALFSVVLFVGVLHVCRKALFDYVKMGDLVELAKQGNLAAATIFQGVCVAMLALAIIIAVAMMTFT